MNKNDSELLTDEAMKTLRRFIANSQHKENGASTSTCRSGLYCLECGRVMGKQTIYQPLCTLCQFKLYNAKHEPDPNSKKNTEEKSLRRKMKKKEEFQCLICKKCFQNKYYLEIHERVHTGDKPYICQVCDRPFSQASSLATHKKIKHNTDKPYECDVCYKKFAIKGYLDVHYRTHTGFKPYECDRCLKCFTQKSTLTTHQKKCLG